MPGAKTIVYVDGYNLYYGLLTRGPHKWLDLVSLCDAIINSSGHASQIVRLKYFTAPIKANERSGRESVQRQQLYHQALKYHSEPLVEIIQGFFVRTQNTLPRADGSGLVDVLRYEEKQTDVSIAVHALLDAMNGEMDHAVVITNDSDLEPLLQGFKSQFPEKKLGHIAPRQKGNDRSVSVRLTQQADWSREYVLEDELAAHQLPTRVVRQSGKRKVYVKPRDWEHLE